MNWAMRLPDEQRYHSSTNGSARVTPDSWLPPRLIASVTLEPSGPRIHGRMSSIDFPCIDNVGDEALQNKQLANSIPKNSTVARSGWWVGSCGCERAECGTCVFLPSTPTMKSPTANAPLEARVKRNLMRCAQNNTAEQSRCVTCPCIPELSRAPGRNLPDLQHPVSLTAETRNKHTKPTTRRTCTLPPAIVDSTRPMPHCTGGLDTAVLRAGATGCVFCRGAGARTGCCCGGRLTGAAAAGARACTGASTG